MLLNLPRIRPRVFFLTIASQPLRANVNFTDQVSNCSHNDSLVNYLLNRVQCHAQTARPLTDGPCLSKLIKLSDFQTPVQV